MIARARHRLCFGIQGKPFALNYSSNGGETFSTYYYILNLQGDVVKLVWSPASGDHVFEYVEVASYTYNAWGEILSSSGEMADVNPLRYRGYYYDSETGLYYLQSRYYDPVTHRFINADAPEYSEMAAYRLDNSNLFVYCGNNPTMRQDEKGEFFGALVGAIGGAIGGFIGAALNGDDPIKGALIGAGTGAAAGACVDVAIATGGLGGVAIAVIGGGIASGADSALNDVANGRDVNIGEAFLSAGLGAATNLLSFGMVDASTLKTGGNIIKTAISNGFKQLMANTTRQVAGKVVYKSTWGVAKNITKNIIGGSISSAIISVFNTLAKKEVLVALQ